MQEKTVLRQLILGAVFAVQLSCATAWSAPSGECETVNFYYGGEGPRGIEVKFRRGVISERVRNAHGASPPSPQQVYFVKLDRALAPPVAKPLSVSELWAVPTVNSEPAEPFCEASTEGKLICGAYFTRNASLSIVFARTGQITDPEIAEAAGVVAKQVRDKVLCSK